MALENTGMIVGERNSALIIAPQSAYIIEAKCANGCPPIYWVASKTWVDDVDLATIFRSIEAGEIALGQARMHACDCLTEKGSVFDAKPLAGYIRL